jgi:hypothetical protein
MPHSVAPINAAINNKATVREDHKEGFCPLSYREVYALISNNNHLLPFVIFVFFVIFV